jgi:transposase-like protein
VRLSRSASAAKPIDYLLKRWSDFTHFADTVKRRIRSMLGFKSMVTADAILSGIETATR